VQIASYCVGGPQVTPHIVAQQLLAAGETRELAPALEPGRYRLRVLGERGNAYVRVGANGIAEARITATDDSWTAREPELRPDPRITIRNDVDRERLYILERTSWSDDATTAAEVTALQQFRDLFSSEALRAGEQIGVGSLAVVFTDLRDSTRMYRRLGDAAAFGRVMSHFDVLRGAIANEQGAIVKTIGDSVMAVFREPVRAVRAVLEMQKQLMMDTNDPLVLKAGIHYGTCIAVTLNDRLDYFGSTVNAAARLDGLSKGGELVMSDAIARDPDVMELLQHANVSAETFAAALKGFEDEPFKLWRVALKDTIDHPPSQPTLAPA
jgi:adenylate cyclase